MSDEQTPTDYTDPAQIDKILDLMRCPLTHSKLRREGDYLVGEVGGLRYPIKGGIPNLLVDEAELPEGISSLDEFKEKYRDQIPE